MTSSLHKFISDYFAQHHILPPIYLVTRAGFNSVIIGYTNPIFDPINEWLQATFDQLDFYVLSSIAGHQIFFDHPGAIAMLKLTFSEQLAKNPIYGLS